MVIITITFEDGVCAVWDVVRDIIWIKKVSAYLTGIATVDGI